MSIEAVKVWFMEKWKSCPSSMLFLGLGLFVACSFCLFSESSMNGACVILSCTALFYALLQLLCKNDAKLAWAAFGILAFCCVLCTAGIKSSKK